MQTDPIGYGAGMNMYAYVGGDPVNGSDPSGLTPRSSDEICTGTRICNKNGAWGGICQSCGGFSSGSPAGQLEPGEGGEAAMGINVYKVTDFSKLHQVDGRPTMVRSAWVRESRPRVDTTHKLLK